MTFNRFVLSTSLLLSLVVVVSIAKADANELEKYGIPEQISTYANLKWQPEIVEPKYSIETATIDDFDFKAVKATLSLSVPFDQAVLLFPQNDACWQWLSRCKSSKTLRQITDDKAIVYTNIDMPWPITDRSFVFLSDTQRSSDRLEMRFIPSDLHVEVEKRTVRGFAYSHYVIEPSSNADIADIETNVTVVMYTNFGGSVSAGLINGKLADEMESDLINLLKLSTPK